MEGLRVEFHPTDITSSGYDWANINLGIDRVGKARCKIENDVFIIYSINVFPDYEGQGIGKAFVMESQRQFRKVVADRVRYTAIGFWEKLGFVDNHDGNWVWTLPDINK